ncbi:MAG: hypothetical protein VYE74_11660 [Verrucomicrobiota bacterium]|nr:hypothetical protein [Verrucomicrobiota bacterium]
MIHIQPMPPQTFRPPDRDYQRFQALSVQRKTSCSAIIREGLNLLLHGKQKASLAQRAAGAIGGASGPADLSTSKKYFKGYGSSGQS